MKWQVPLLMIAVCLGTVAQAQVWRVDPTSPGTQDGLSWATAFHTIQPAIDAAYAAGGGEVWVAGGTIGSPRVYNELRTEAWGSPASVTGSLVMKDNVHVYGGFSGYNGGAGRQETQRSQRNWYLYPAVIDGSTSRAGSPAYHVVVFGRASAPTVNARLDGFTITGGNASGVTGDYHTWRGGGIYAWQSAAEVENCIIHNCTAAVSGGAIANETGPNGQSLSLIRSCLIRNNTANRAADSSANPIRGGAGIFNNNADAVIVGCTIVDGTLTDNTTGLFGRDSGGVYNWESAPIINNCIFYLNTGDGATGSVVSQGSLGNTEVPVFSYTLAGVTFPGTGNIGGVNPQLDTNYVPLASSPVINVGNPGLTTGTDNRGVARQVGPSADIGAMEYSPNGPSAVCQSASVDLTVRNQITDPAEISLSTAEAGIWLQEVENKTFSCSDIPSGTLQLTVTDVLGRTATCTATINVTESEPPVITLNGASVVTVECGTAYTEQGATATDNCDTNVTISIAGTVDTANPGDYVLTYTATDDVGNSASVQRTVQVRDTTPPPLTLNGPDPMVVECGSTFTDPGVTVADSCDMMVAYTVSGTVDTSVPGSYTLTYNAQDGSGNVAVPITRVVNVVDTTAPVITLNGASPMTVECGSTFTDPGATVTDACDPAAGYTVTGSVNTAVPGSYTLTYYAVDASSNSATPVVRVVNVVDTTAPVITLIGANPLTVECGSTFTDPGANAVDACEGPVAVTVAGSVDTATPGSYTLTYTAADSQSNSDSVVRTVNVVDTTAPVITIPGPNPVNVPQNAPFTAPTASATDVCEGNLGSVTGVGTVDTSTPGTYTVTYTASDSASNTAVETLTVEVLANLPPVINILGDNPVVLECGDEYTTDAGATAADYEDGDLTASITVTGLPPAGPLSPGTWTITYSVTDSYGETATAQRTVDVLDTSIPVVTISGGNTLNAECGVALTLPDATAADDCAGTLAVTVTDLDGLDVNAPAVGTYDVVYSANDGYNTGTATLTVTVTDTQAPVLSVPGPNPVYVHTGDAYSPPVGTAVDTCEGTSAVIPMGMLDVNTPGTYTLIYTAADSSANQTQYILTVEVADDFAPVITLAGGSAVTLDCGDQYTTAGVATATDIEDGDITALVIAAGEPPAGPLGPGSWTVTFSVTDSFGNTATAQQVVTVQNNCTLAVTANATTIDAVVGDSVSLSVTVSGAVGAVSYQWYREDGSKAWQAISGANSDTLTFDPVALTDAGQYQCEVSDAVTSVNSPTFTLNVSNGVPAAGFAGLCLLGVTLAGLGALRRRNR